MNQNETKKRKNESTKDTNKNVEKIQKMNNNKMVPVASSSKFVNALVGKWLKHTESNSQYTQGMESTVLNPSENESEKMDRLYIDQEKKINGLQKKMVQLQKENSTLSTNIDNYEREKEELEAKISSICKAVHCLDQHLEYINECLMRFQESAANLEAVIKTIVEKQSALEARHKKLDKIQIKVSEQKTIIEETEKKLSLNQNRTQELEIMYQQMQKTKEEVECKLSSQINYLQDLLSQEKQNISKEREQIQAKNNELLSKLQSISEEKQDAMKLLSEKETRILQLQQQIEYLSSDRTDLAKTVEKRDNEFQELRENLKKKLDEMQLLQKELDSSNEQKNQFMLKVNALEEEINSHTKRCKTLELSLQTLETKLKEADFRYVELKQITDNIKVNDDNFIKRLRDDIESMKKQEENYKQHKDNLRSLKEEHTKEMSKLKKTFESKLFNMEKAMTQKNNDLSSANEKLNKMEDENKQIRKELSEALKETENLDKSHQRSIKLLEDKIAELKNQLKLTTLMEKINENPITRPKAISCSQKEESKKKSVTNENYQSNTQPLVEKMKKNLSLEEKFDCLYDKVNSLDIYDLNTEQACTIIITFTNNFVSYLIN